MRPFLEERTFTKPRAAHGAEALAEHENETLSAAASVATFEPHLARLILTDHAEPLSSGRRLRGGPAGREWLDIRIEGANARHVKKTIGRNGG